MAGSVGWLCLFLTSWTDPGSFQNSCESFSVLGWITVGLRRSTVLTAWPDMVYASGRNVNLEQRFRLSADLTFANRAALYNESWHKRVDSAQGGLTYPRDK